MYSRNSFGSYYPVNSIIHKLNPVIKLFNFLIVIVLIILSNSIYVNSFILGLLIIMMLLSYVPFNYYFKKTSITGTVTGGFTGGILNTTRSSATVCPSVQKCPDEPSV